MGGTLGGILQNVPLPLDDPIALLNRDGLIGQKWVDYFTAAGTSSAVAATRVASVAIFTQTAGIGATDISNGNLAPGVYDFGYYIRVTTAGGAGFTLQVTLDWIDGGVARSFSGAVINGTVLANNESESKLIRIDGASPVRYSVQVGGGIPPTMAYAIDVVLLRVDA